MTKEKQNIKKGNNTLADLKAEEYAIMLETATDKLKYLIDKAYNVSVQTDVTDPVSCIFNFKDIRQLVDIAGDYVNDALDSLEELQKVLNSHTLKERKTA